MVVGFVISGPDNGADMTDGAHGPTSRGRCQHVIDLGVVNPEMKLPPATPDVSFTYDGYLIVSERVRSILDCDGELLPLPAAPGFYSVAPTDQVAFDAVRRKTRFEDPCPVCGDFQSVVGATPVYLLVDAPLGAGLYRTDICFGSELRWPLVVVGPRLAETLEAANLSGLSLHPATGA